MSLSLNEINSLLSEDSNDSVVADIGIDEINSLLGDKKEPTHLRDFDYAKRQASGGSRDERLFQDLLGHLAQAQAFSSAGKKGLFDFLSGAAKLGAKGVDYATGSDLEQKVPSYQPSQMEGLLSKIYPKTATVGGIAGGIAPLLGMPELGIESLLGRTAAQAGIGAALGPVYDPDSPITESALRGALTGAAGPAIVAPAAKLISKGVKGALGLGGTATKKTVEKVQKAAESIGVKLPVAESIKSPSMAKLQKVGLKNIPFSGMPKAYSDISTGIESKLSGLLDKLNPENEHSGEAVKNFLTSKHKDLTRKVDSLYSDVRKEATSLNPGKVHNRNKLSSEAKNILVIMNEKEKLPGGGIKVPESVKNIAKEASKRENVSILDAFSQDEIINDHLFEAKREGDKRAVGYLSKLKKANLDDIDDTIVKLKSPVLSHKWSQAKEFYKKNLVPYNKKGSVLRKIIDQKTSIDDVRGLFLKTSGQQPKSEILKSVSKELPQEIKDKISHDYLLGPFGDKGEINVSKILNKSSKLQPKQKSLLFSKENKSMLDNMETIKKHIGSSEFNQMFIPQTGAQIAMKQQYMAPLAAATLGLKAGGPVGAATSVGGLLAGGKLMTKAIMSDKLKKSYLKSLKMSGVPKGVIKQIEKMPLLSLKKNETSKGKR